MESDEHPLDRRRRICRYLFRTGWTVSGMSLVAAVAALFLDSPAAAAMLIKLAFGAGMLGFLGSVVSFGIRAAEPRDEDDPRPFSLRYMFSGRPHRRIERDRLAILGVRIAGISIVLFMVLGLAGAGDLTWFAWAGGAVGILIFMAGIVRALFG